MKNRIKLVEITRSNLYRAIMVAKEIFSHEITPSGSFPPGKDYKLSLGILKGKRKYFLAKQGRHIIGITGYYYNSFRPKPDELWLGWFGVRKKYRRRGFGEEMLKLTIRIMKATLPNELRTIKLFTSTHKSEKNSHHLYRKLGFTVYAQRDTNPRIYYFKKAA